MNPKLRKLLAAKEANVNAAAAISAKADEDGILSEDDQKEFDALMAKVDSQNKAIANEQSLLTAQASLGGTEIVSEVDGGGEQSTIVVGEDRATLDPMMGFAGLGDFASCVVQAQSGHFDDRMLVGAATPSSLTKEAVGVDGGFLVPPAMSQEIFRLMLEEESYIPLTANQQTEGNTMTYRNTGEVTPWGGTGLQANWVEEGKAIPQSKISPKTDEIKLHKLAILAPVSGEMMQDYTALNDYLTQEAADAIRWKANDAIINGDGVGKPKGILESDALVVQAKETSQTADTIVAANAAKMLGRLHGRTSGQRVLISPDAFNQIMLMTLGNQPIWTPPTAGFKDAPSGFLLGRPIILSDHLQTLGNQDDFLFVDFGFYRTLNKVGGGIRTDVSMHLYFDSDNMAFRFTFRLGGQSKMTAAITPENSAETRSPFVTLAVRS